MKKFSLPFSKVSEPYPVELRKVLRLSESVLSVVFRCQFRRTIKLKWLAELLKSEFRERADLKKLEPASDVTACDAGV